MNPLKPSGDEDRLQRLLRDWTVNDPLPPRFQEDVWARISRAEAAGAPGLWAGISRLFEVVLPRPKFALSYVAGILVLGLAAGAVAAQVRTSRLDAALGARYVQSIDPFLTATTSP